MSWFYVTYDDSGKDPNLPNRLVNLLAPVLRCPATNITTHRDPSQFRKNQSDYPAMIVLNGDA